MSQLPPCPQCKAEFTYANDDTLVCPMCFNEWKVEPIAGENIEETPEGIIKDAHGNILSDGDTVVLIKDLPVKGAPKNLKAGTKVKNIRLRDGDHNIECKIEGFGTMFIKSEFVKK